MAKKKSIKWIKLSVNFMEDERIEQMERKLGSPAIGMYFCIILEIYRRVSRSITLRQLKSLKMKACSWKTTQSIVNDFGLFTHDDMEHYYSAVDFLGFDDDDKHEDGDAEEHPIFNQNVIEMNFKSSQSRARNNKDIDIDKKETTSQKKVQVQCLMPLKSEWAEQVIMRSSYSALLRNYWTVAIDYFYNHTIAQANESMLYDEKNARRYFANFCSNVITSAKLKAFLTEYDRNHPEQNPYRFEDAGSAPGHRSYLGSPLPDDAPPRPSKTADWVDGNWVDAFGENNNTNINTKTKDYEY